MNEYMFLVPISLFLLLGVISPGPSFLLVAQTALSKSRSEAAAVSLGMGFGSAIFAIIASAGIFILLDSVPWLYICLKIMGGLYLCFLAYKMWGSSTDKTTGCQNHHTTQHGLLKSFSFGLITQLSNPKTAIVFASAFVAFLPKELPEYTYLYIIALAFFIDTIWYVIVSTLLSTKKAQKVYEKFKNLICKVASGFMGIMGIKLLFSQSHP